MTNIVCVRRFSGLVDRGGIILFRISRSVSIRYMPNFSGREMFLTMGKAFLRQPDLHVVIQLITKKDGDRLINCSNRAISSAMRPTTSSHVTAIFAAFLICAIARDDIMSLRAIFLTKPRNCFRFHIHLSLDVLKRYSLLSRWCRP